MDKSLLVKFLCFLATLIQGDTLNSDRWLLLRKRLPKTRQMERLIYIGCGSGAFSIGSALRGYDVLGISWDERNQRVTGERAEICNAITDKFDVLDVRRLNSRDDLAIHFDVAICKELLLFSNPRQ